MDCVSEDGAAVVLYWARLRWGVATIRYGAVITKRKDRGPMQHYSLRPGPGPVATGKELRWACAKLDVQGSWTPFAPSIRRTLIETPRGSIHWHCLAPAAHSSVRVGTHLLEGLGYVERLDVSIKPWRLPFDHLRWGRFLSHSDVVIWIKWSGSTERTTIFHNGIEQEGATLGAQSVHLPNGVVVEFHEAQILRSGPLASTALALIPCARRLIPRFGNAHETKWLAPGIAHDPDGGQSGWVVYEEVRW